MRVALHAAKRTAQPRWICKSCYSSRLASTASSTANGAPSAAAEQLRKAGPARTRFAPSPTGYLHLGSLRTALFNYLVAKATGGQFLLRIEDTDQKRTVPDAEERLYKDLEWSGIEWDEGPNIGGPYGPYKQSQRTGLYREHAHQLVQNGSAYRCFCSPEQLHTRAQHRANLGLPPDYDRTCAHMPKEESDDRAARGDAHVIRLLAPNVYPEYRDLVYGRVRQRREKTLKVAIGESFDDPVLLKSDGFPTYHLANVVDDHLMEITHVIRGAEWMSSTPKHLAMYQAFGWSPPQFAHVGLLLDDAGQKLSKRHEATNLSELRDELGVFPETLMNFVALLGWSHKARNDTMSMEDLIRNASMKFTTGDTKVSFEKLWFLQRRHAARYAADQPPKPANPFHDLEELAVKPTIASAERQALQAPERFSFYTSIPEGNARFEFVRSIVWADAANYTKPDDFISRNAYLFAPPDPSSLSLTPPDTSLHLLQDKPNSTVPLPVVANFFQTLLNVAEEEWNKTALTARVEEIVMKGITSSIEDASKIGGPIDAEQELAISKSWRKLVHSYIRSALVQGMHGPTGVGTMLILGRTETLRRLEIAAKAWKSDKETSTAVEGDNA